MLKSGGSSSLICPMCDIEVPMAGDEKPGESLMCPYCQTPLIVRKKKDTDVLYLQEDF